MARRPAQWAACLKGVGRAARPARSRLPRTGPRGRAPPGRPAAGGVGRRGKAAGAGLRVPAAPISARPVSPGQGARVARGTERAVEAREPPLPSQPQAARRSPLHSDCRGPRRPALRHGLSFVRGGSRSEPRPPRWGMGSAAWLRPPPARPDFGGRRGPGSSRSRTASRCRGKVGFGPPAGLLTYRPPRTKMLHFKEVHYVCVAHLRPHSL